jgi:error-prone DNA polymerase
VAEAARLGLRSIALTDRDGLYGAVRAHVKAREMGVHLILGSEITIDTGARVILLATSKRGYANLCRLVSKGRLRSPKGSSSVSWSDVFTHTEDLLALWPGYDPSLLGTEAPDVAFDPAALDAFAGRFYVLLARHRRLEDPHRENALRRWAKRFGVPVAAGTEVLYHVPARRELQDIVTCIRHGTSLAAAGTLLRPNDEHALKPPHAFEGLFRDDPEAVSRTLEIAERCTFSLAEIRYRYPSEKLPDGTTSAERLRFLVRRGTRQRYPKGTPPEVLAQIDKELSLIHELEYDGYFLTMWEIIRFCRSREILCQGRGSAANSAVCFVLGVTSVDPVRMGLLFERFLSKERGEPPDIDLDIEHNRREEVIQFVYERYGRDRAAMVANVIRYRPRSAIREVGKALGLPETMLDRFAKLLSHYEAPTPESLAEVGFDETSPAHRHLLRLTHEIQSFPRHLSIHPGGFLLGHEPVHDLVPIENATMPGRTVIQWDKEDLEDLGLFKVDLLGLGALHVVKLSFDLLDAHWGRRFTMASIPADDEPTYRMIQQADTVGVFQIESRAQMSMLPRLRPRNYYDLVIEVSIVRPGPITGGMVHPYLRRRSGEEVVNYAHPLLKPVLEKTLGVPIFQEQVMKLAVVAADYSPGEADQLRRDMAAWQRSGRIERHHERLVSRMIQKGIPEEFAERVFQQIRGFGEYGFPESHAASFALIAYATAWLKCHYAAAFTCALLNAQPMGFYSVSTLVEDAKRHGVVIRSVDVCRSDDACTLEPCPESTSGFAVRVGLRFVKGLASQDRLHIVDARGSSPFESLDSFVSRTRLERASLVKLAKAGAFGAFDDNRRSTFWDSLGAYIGAGPELRVEEYESPTSFRALSDLETIHWDHEALGQSTHGHPVGPFREALRSHGLPDAETVRGMKNGGRVNYAGLVICRQRPGTARGVVFMTLEDETGFVNVVLWENVFRQYRLLVKTSSFLGVSGKLQVEQGVVHVVADRVWSPDLESKPHPVASRDFH